MSRPILLVGLTGCGKTTLGKLACDRLSFRFIDMDIKIEQEQGRTIPQIFEQGEQCFRDIESDMLLKLSDCSDVVIASGGGIVEREQNRDIMKERYKVIMIDRDVDSIFSDIDTSHRPLLADGKDRLYKLHERRDALYRHSADVIIKNDGTEQDAVEKLVSEIEKDIKEV